jgi:hypothetical protein
LAQFLSKATALQSLDISKSPLKDEGALIVLEALCSNAMDLREFFADHIMASSNDVLQKLNELQ